MLMKLFNEINYPGFSKILKQIKVEEFEPYDKRISRQNKALQALVKHAFENVPYYRKISRDIGLHWRDIKTIDDLKSMPIISKQEIKENIKSFYFEDFKAIDARTGGTTGQPLHYKISEESYYRGRALLYNGWGRAGYKRGEKMLIFAGGSIVSKRNIKSSLLEKIHNIHYESSFGVTDEKLDSISRWIVTNRPKYIRGYASSVALLANWFKVNGYKYKELKGCITTSEPLQSSQRKLIMETFNTEVFDTYGLNDGGASAFECEAHNGMHIDLFRSIFELCDLKGNRVEKGEEGRVIVTDLYNYAFPFIRYDTGDIAKISYETCTCGRTAPRIIEIKGRQADTLEFSKHSINGNFLTVLLGKTKVDMYKIIQTDLNVVEIHMLYLSNNNFNIDKDKKFITTFFMENAPEAKVRFIYYRNYTDFPKDENKLRFIINQCKTKVNSI